MAEYTNDHSNIKRFFAIAARYQRTIRPDASLGEDLGSELRLKADLARDAFGQALRNIRADYDTGACVNAVDIAQRIDQARAAYDTRIDGLKALCRNPRNLFGD